MRDLQREEWFLISHARRMVGKSPSTIWKLIRYGRKSVSGVLVKLEWMKTEGGLATSVEALRRFRQRLNDIEPDNAT